MERKAIVVTSWEKKKQLRKSGRKFGLSGWVQFQYYTFAILNARFRRTFAPHLLLSLVMEWNRSDYCRHLFPLENTRTKGITR